MLVCAIIPMIRFARAVTKSKNGRHSGHARYDGEIITLSEVVTRGSDESEQLP